MNITKNTKTIPLLYHVLDCYGEDSVRHSFEISDYKFPIHIHSHIGFYIKELSDRGVLDYSERPIDTVNDDPNGFGGGFIHWSVKEEYKPLVELWLV